MSARLGRFALVAAALAVAGCGEAVPRGTLAKLPVKLAALGYHPSVTLAVAAPRDARPAVEHEGDSIGTSTFFTTLVVTRWERRGNYVTDDETVSTALVPELQADVIDALKASNVARSVVPGGAAEFELSIDVEHLYGTHYAVNEGTVVVFSTRGARGGGLTSANVVAGKRQYASYGNAVLHARLVDRRGHEPVVVWDEHITGSGQQMPQKEPRLAAQTAARQAVADALGELAVRVAAALDRLEVGPSGPGHALSGELPPVFVLERVSRYRDFLERVYVETTTGRALRHDILPNADRALGRPGDWLLSRRTPEGVELSAEGYHAYARALAARYDLRTVDDAYRYHFFGVRGVAPPPTLGER